MIPGVDHPDADEEPRPVPEDDLSRRFEELSRTIREHLEGLDQ
ncbi:hypothetical protein WDH52_08645 [Streptomyces sp. TRM70308]